MITPANFTRRVKEAGIYVSGLGPRAVTTLTALVQAPVLANAAGGLLNLGPLIAHGYARLEAGKYHATAPGQQWLSRVIELGIMNEEPVRPRRAAPKKACTPPAAPLTPEVWHRFLQAVGPRRTRLITVKALLRLAMGGSVLRSDYGDAVFKWLRTHMSAWVESPTPGLFRPKAGAALLQELGLPDLPTAAVLRRLVVQALKVGMAAPHLAALLYALEPGGVTASDLHQRPWSAKRTRVSRPLDYLDRLVSAGLLRVCSTDRSHRGLPVTTWHTTPKGRALVLAEWTQESPPQPTRRHATDQVGTVERNIRRTPSGRFYAVCTRRDTTRPTRQRTQSSRLGTLEEARAARDAMENRQPPQRRYPGQNRQTTERHAAHC